MGTLWNGEWLLAPGRLILLGEFGPVSAHHHPAVQVTLALQGSFIVANRHGELPARAVVIPTGATHALAPADPSTRALSIYLHPACADGRKLTAAHGAGRDPSDWIAAARPIADHRPVVHASVAATAAGVVKTLIGPAANDVPVHPAVRDAFAMLSAAFPRKLHLRDLARSLSLSESALSRIFIRETGVGYLASVRWNRLLRGLVEIEAGATITEAAHAAGFADSAHATRVCREMAGVPPSELLGMTRSGRTASTAPSSPLKTQR